MSTDQRSRGAPQSEIRGSLSRRTFVRGAVAAATVPSIGFAQTGWPSKPIRIIVGAPPGGLIDIYARRYGEFLSAKLGQPVLVENRPGASGTLAAGMVAKSAADGHTLAFVIHAAVWGGRVLYKNLPYEPDRDLVPVSLFSGGPAVMGVHAGTPIKTPADLLEYARTNPVSMGTYAPASWPHMIADTWNRKLGLNILAVHYKGETPMWMDISTGQVTVGVGSSHALGPHLQRGAVRPIAILGSYRSPALPNVPLFSELGMKEPILGLNGWLPLCAPAGTPTPVLERLASGIAEAYQSPKIREFHASVGVPNGPTGLEESSRRWKEDGAQWIAMSKQLGITLD